MDEKVVGLLGGMGPEATIDIFQKIVRATHAKKDDNHLRIIIDNNPKMPSRQDAILKGTEDPGPYLVRTSINLEKAGADFIIICANTAHYFYESISSAVHIPVLHIIKETVKKVEKDIPDIQTVGVLATSGAMKVKIYHDCFHNHGIMVADIPDKIQNKIQESIFSYKYDGKNDYNVGLMEEAVDYLLEKDVQAIVLGCTEIPLILEGIEGKIPFIDPNEVIAEVAVKYAKQK